MNTNIHEPKVIEIRKLELDKPKRTYYSIELREETKGYVTIFVESLDAFLDQLLKTEIEE